MAAPYDATSSILLYSDGSISLKDYNHYRDFIRAATNVERTNNGEAPKGEIKFVPDKFTFGAAAQAFGQGISDAATVMANEFTFKQIDSLNQIAEEKIKADPNLIVAQVGAVVARECITTVATGGAATVLGKAGGRIVGVVVTKVAPKTAQAVTTAAATCKVQTAANVVKTSVTLYLAKDQIVTAIDAAKGAYDAYEQGASPDVIAEKLTKAGIEIAQLGYTGAQVFDMAKKLGKQGFVKFFSACFAAGTNVLTDRGWIAIEEIQAGDLVWSRSHNGPDNECSFRAVEFTMKRSSYVVELHLGGQVLMTTDEHPFWVKDRGWVSTNELKPGDLLAGKDGEWTAVDKLVQTGEYVEVFNFHVPGDHTYFVGGSGWRFSVWAHNTGTTGQPCQVAGANQATTPSTASAPPSSNQNLWTKSQVQGRTVYKRNDLFDPERKSSWIDPTTGQWRSGTNVQRMNSGLAPIGNDGRPVQLHHLTGTEVNGFNGSRGSVAEVSATFHQENTSALHIPNAKSNPNYVQGGNHPRQVPQYPSFRRDNDGNLTNQAQEFDTYREAYWQSRAKDFDGK